MKQAWRKDSKSVLYMLMTWCLNATYDSWSLQGQFVLVWFDLDPIMD